MPLKPSKNPAVAAIEYAVFTDEPQAFLKCWLEGDWEAIRKEWPNAPEECYVQMSPTVFQLDIDRREDPNN
jgi:hypothetical protein